MMIPFTLNGSEVFIDANPGERLVHALRRFGLAGTKEGCLSGKCGSCMVLMNGNPVPSCIIPVFQAKNAVIVTIERFAESDEYRDIIEGFKHAGVSMCGFCNTGKILVAHALLNENVKPTKSDINNWFSGNLCRCTSIDDLYAGVKQAGILRRKRDHAK